MSNCATKDGSTYIIDLRGIKAEGNGCHTIYISDSSKQKLLHKIVYYVCNNLSFNVTGNGYVFDRNTINFAIQKNDGGMNHALYSCNPQSGLESLSCPFEDNRYEIASGVSSTFDADIVDGEYTVSVYIVDFFGELEAVPIFEEDCIIGNPDKFYFARSRIILNSFKKPEGGKIRLNNVFITDIQYLREEAIGAVYSGTLICNRKRFPVEVYKKGNSSLKFYIIDGDILLSANFNVDKNEFVKEEPNEKNIIPCSSCYYTKEIV